MLAKLPIALLALAATAPAPSAPCASLDRAAPVETAIPPGAAVCFLLSVADGNPIQLVAEQPVDIAIRVRRDDSGTIFDGFQFGPETATILEPGQYRVELRRVVEARTTVTLLMSRKRLPLQQAALWRAAEEAATKSKQSGKLTDIATSLERWQAIGDSSAIARTELKQGDAAIASQDSESAGAFYAAALDDCRALSDLRCIAEAANNTAFAARRLGDFDRSIALLNEAAEAWTRVGRRDLEGRTLSNLGLLLWQTGDYTQSVAYFGRASDLLRSRDKLAYARALNNLGLCYRAMAENVMARRYFARAIDGFVSEHSPRDAARARRNLGFSWLLDGNTAAALKAFNEALAEADPADRAGRAEILGSIGQTLVARHRPEEARAPLETALELHRALRDRTMEALDLHNLGTAEGALGHAPKAREYLAEALRIRRAIGLRDPAIDSLLALAELDRADGNSADARDFADQALKLMESVRINVPGAALRASYFSRRRRIFDLLIGIDTAPNGPDSAEAGFLAAERGRGRALLDLLAEGTFLPDAPADLLQRRRNVERRIDLLTLRLSTASPAAAEPLLTQVETLVAENERIEAGIRNVLDPKLSVPLESVREVQQALPPDTALVEYYLGEEESFLWLVRPGGIQLFRLPARAKIEAESAPVLSLFPQAVERKRESGKQRTFDRAMRRLSATLLGPLNGIELPARLILVPDGVLTRVPFAALELAGSRRLGLTHDLVQTTSAAYLTAGRQPRPVREFPKAFLALADPVFSVPGQPESGTALARLPFTGEIDAVGALVPAARRRVLRGFDANPAALRAQPLADYAVLHFSTHAIVDDRIPELSRIALSTVGPAGRPREGFLRPAQLSALHLNGSIVVLAACETALGRQVLGEGLAGFTSSLFHAGAAQLVMALADVDNEGSSEFLAETYRNLFGRNGNSVEHAMTRARAVLSKSERWSDPWYWASFTVYGRPGEPR